MSVNKVILIGNLGKDPEVKYVMENVPVATFTLATSETYKDKNGERQESTEWHNIVLWRGLAEIAEKYLKKGKQIYLEGRIKTRSYDDKDGVKRYITEIVGDQMKMLGGREENSANQGVPSGYAEKIGKPQEQHSPSEHPQESQPQGQQQPDISKMNVDDDLPF